MNITFKDYRFNVNSSQNKTGIGFKGTYIIGDRVHTWHQVDTDEFEYVESCYCNETNTMTYSGSK